MSGKDVVAFTMGPNPYQPPTAPSVSTPDPKTDARSDGYWALALGLLSIFLCAPITAPLAIWKAQRAMRADASGLGSIAILFAIVGLLTSVFLWGITIWQLLDPNTPHRN